MEGQADLFQIVAALRPSSRFTSLLHRRQQKRDQDANDCDDNQKFYQGKRISSLRDDSPFPTG